MTKTHSTAPWQYDKKTNHVVSGKSKKRIATIETQGMGYEVDPNGKLIESAPVLLEHTKMLQKVLQYQIKKDRMQGDKEGANLKEFTLEKITKDILNAEGNLFWTFELDGEIYDGDFDSRDEADNHAQEKYAEDCQEESPRNGETFERDDYALIEYSYDDDNERVIYGREDAVLEYEHYHGDAKEHGYP